MNFKFYITLNEFIESVFKILQIFKYNTDENTLDILKFAGCAASIASIDRTPLIYRYIKIAIAVKNN